MVFGYCSRAPLSPILSGGDNGCFSGFVARVATEVCEGLYDTLRRTGYVSIVFETQPIAPLGNRPVSFFGWSVPVPSTARTTTSCCSPGAS